MDNVSFSHGVDTRSQGGSSFLAYFNVVCVVAGTGALGLPYSLKQGGWIGKEYTDCFFLYYFTDFIQVFLFSV